jgi:hypothetical protein
MLRVSPDKRRRARMPRIRAPAHRTIFRTSAASTRPGSEQRERPQERHPLPGSAPRRCRGQVGDVRADRRRCSSLLARYSGSRVRSRGGLPRSGVAAGEALAAGPACPADLPQSGIPMVHEQGFDGRFGVVLR